MVRYMKEGSQGTVFAVEQRGEELLRVFQVDEQRLYNRI